MVIIELFLNYWWWHYTRAIADIISIWSDLLWFAWNYFSIGQLTRTFFVPWRRLHEEKESVFRIVNYVTAIIVTLLMRLVGMLIRSVVILVGLCSIILLLVAGVWFLLIWLLMPILLALILVVGYKLAMGQY